ncbi:hypothetical protein SATRI_v1c01870 [Spiroplasma atrichopogonis]|nr:hypothetical protein SATRI_v1c01870 [Spiroplasma atrichopogonis]
MNWKIELITIIILFIITIVWQIIIGFLGYKKEIEGKKLLILLVLPLLFFIFGILIMNVIKMILCFIS